MEQQTSLLMVNTVTSQCWEVGAGLWDYTMSQDTHEDGRHKMAGIRPQEKLLRTSSATLHLLSSAGVALVLR